MGTGIATNPHRDFHLSHCQLMERRKGTEKPNNSVPIDKGNFGIWSIDFASSQGGGCWFFFSPNDR